MAQSLPLQSVAVIDQCNKFEPAIGTGQLKWAESAPSGSQTTSPQQLQKVVTLSAEHGTFDDDPDAPAPHWPSALQLIRDVGAQVRLER